MASGVIGMLSRGEVERIVVRPSPQGSLRPRVPADVLRSFGIERLPAKRRDPNAESRSPTEDSYPGG